MGFRLNNFFSGSRLFGFQWVFTISSPVETRVGQWQPTERTEASNNLSVRLCSFAVLFFPFKTRKMHNNNRNSIPMPFRYCSLSCIKLYLKTPLLGYISCVSNNYYYSLIVMRSKLPTFHLSVRI